MRAFGGDRRKPPQRKREVAAMETARCIGARVGVIRKRRGLTQADLAERIDRSVEAVSSLERGKHMPSFDILQRLASALDVPIQDFLAPAGCGSEAASPEHAALFSELLATARALPLADLEKAVKIIGVVAGQHGG